MDISLNTSELILLKYLNDFKQGEQLPNYFSSQHGLNVEDCIKKFWDNRLISYSPVNDVLKHYTIPQLKSILSDNNLSVSGKKNMLIERIIANIDIDLLESKLDKYISITPKGKEQLETLSDDEYKNRYSLNYLIPNIENLMTSIINNDFIDIGTNIPFEDTYDKYTIKSCQSFYKTSSLSNEVKAIIILGFLQGNRPETIQQSIRYYLSINVDISNIHRGIAWIRSYSELTKLKDYENEQIKYIYTIKTAKDNSVCSYCNSLQDKTFDLADAIIGVNYPPFNSCTCEHCRCYATHKIKIDNN